MSRALTPIETFRTDLVKLGPQLKAVLPPNITPEKFERVVLTAVGSMPMLLEKDRKSLFEACLRCATDGLIPDGRESALVPFKDRVQYLPMIGGILKKVRQSGELATITAQIVYQKDEFKYWVDEEGEHLTHHPDVLSQTRGTKVGAYAIAKTKDGHLYIEVMTAAQILTVKNKSAKNGPWHGDFEDEMWRKTALKRLSKRLPMSTDLEEVLRRDDELYDLKGQDEEVEAKPGPKNIQTAELDVSTSSWEDDVDSSPVYKATRDELIKDIKSMASKLGENIVNYVSEEFQGLKPGELTMAQMEQLHFQLSREMATKVNRDKSKN